MKGFLFVIFGLVSLPVVIVFGIVGIVFAIVEVGASLLKNLFMLPLGALNKKIDKINQTAPNVKKPRFVKLSGTAEMKSSIGHGKNK